MKKIILCIALLLSQLASAETDTVKIVVPFTPGGPTDIIARAIQHALQEKMNKTIVVESRPGAASTIGTAYVANSDPKETVLLVSASTTYINLLIKKSTGYNSNQLAPLVYLGNAPFVLLVSPKLGVKNFGEFKKLDLSRPLNYGSGGVGTTSYLSAVHLQKYLGKEYTNINFNGLSPVITNLIAGNIDFAFVNYSSVLQYLDSKKLIAIAIDAEHRVNELPDVPSYPDLGIPYPGDINWYMIWSNQTTNMNDRSQIQEIMTQVVSDPEKVKTFTNLGVQINKKTIIPTPEFINQHTQNIQTLLNYIKYNLSD